MVDYGDFVHTVHNKITIRGLDTISIAPFSQTKWECVGSDKILDYDIKCDSSSDHGDSWSLLESQQTSDQHQFVYSEDMIVNRPLKPKGKCNHYMDYEEFTHMFVDDILKTAIDYIKDKNKEAVILDETIETPIRNLKSWPTIAHFDETLGAKKLTEYIDLTAEVTEEWLYSIELIARQSNDYSDFYKYEATFGIPSKCYPIAQATASVYFTYEVSRVKPRYCPVDVTFQYEASSCVMMPGRHVIKEELLFRIVETKLTCFKTITF